MSINGQTFVQGLVIAGVLPVDTDANEMMAAAHRGETRGRRYVTVQGMPQGVLDRKTGDVLPTPADGVPTVEDARDWAAELNG